jgi:hypothetical protein
MTRRMRDSTEPKDIPLSGLDLVLGYIDGPFKWLPSGWERFPGTVKRVRCATRSSTNDGHVLDCEPGDATPAQAVTWVRTRRQSGLRQPIVYCGAARWPHVKDAFVTAGVRQPDYIVAHYGVGPNIPPGAVGIQFADPNQTGAHYDESAMLDHIEAIDGALAPVEDPDMLGTDPVVWTSVVDGKKHTENDVNDALAAGLVLRELYAKGFTGVGTAGPGYLDLIQVMKNQADEQATLAAVLGLVKTSEQATDAPGGLTTDEANRLAAQVVAGVQALLPTGWDITVTPKETL